MESALINDSDQSTMRKLLMGVLLFAGSSVCGINETNAHNWGYEKKLCYPLHPRFGAFAQVQVGTIRYGGRYGLLGRWIAETSIGWTVVDDDSQKGCARPREAYALKYMQLYDFGFWGWYGANAGWSVEVGGATGGYQWAHWTNSYRMRPGVSQEIVMDSTKFAELNKEGNSFAELTGDISIDSTNTELTISRLNGQISIYPGSNFISTYKVLVIKQKKDLTKEEAAKFYSLGTELIFDNIVASGEITVNRNGIKTGGFLAQIVDTENQVNSESAFGVNLENIGGTFGLEEQLADDETLILVTYSDGGFDFDLALPDASIVSKPAPTHERTLPLVADVRIYPNPATNQLNIDLIASKETKSIVQIYDLTGRMVSQVYEGNLNEGKNTISGVNVSNLPKGLYTLKVIQNNKSTNHKFVIN